MEVKEYDLRLIVNKKINLSVGVPVSLTDSSPSEVGDIYYIEKVIHEPTGFTFLVNDVWYYGGDLYPLEPILTSIDDIICVEDKIFYNGLVETVVGLFEIGDNWIINCASGLEIIDGIIFKVVSIGEFGWLYNEGPIHDNNYNFGDGRYLEEYLGTCLLRFIDNNCKVSVVVTEVCLNFGGIHLNNDCECSGGFGFLPLLHKGKVIIDIYGLLKSI